MQFILIVLVLALCLCGRAQAKVYMTQQQAISATFPSHQVQRKTLFLSKDQAQQIEQLARAKLDSRIISYYVGRSGGKVAGIVFFDRQTVRTMPMTYAVTVTPSGEIDHVDVLSFDEPDDYLPPQRWLRLYRSRMLNNDLSIGRSIPHITGASLTSQAINDGVRKALATFQIAVKGRL